MVDNEINFKAGAGASPHHKYGQIQDTKSLNLHRGEHERTVTQPVFLVFQQTYKKNTTILVK
jgi:hypothetical protein